MAITYTVLTDAERAAPYRDRIRALEQEYARLDVQSEAPLPGEGDPSPRKKEIEDQLKALNAALTKLEKSSD